MNVVEYNSRAWDKAVENGISWSVPVDEETIAAARNGEWSVCVTPSRAVPRDWFGELSGKDVLCLASGGGQQAPIIAAAGARVTSFDNSAKQLEQDRFVAQREGLAIRLERGDSADLSRFANSSFDLVFNPCSNCFMPKLQPIWNECFRVLRRRGILIVGFTKPEVYIFDRFKEEQGLLEVTNSLPYSDAADLGQEELKKLLATQDALEFSHTLEEQLGGQIAAGFHIVGYYDDYWATDDRPLNNFMPSFGATRAVKP